HVTGVQTCALPISPEVDVRSGWDFFAGQAFGASEETRHLRSGDVVVRTETVVRRGVAAAGDTCRSERIDILFEDRAVVVVEAIGLGGAVAVGSRQERGHLTSRNGAVRAEPVVVGRVTAAGDPGGSQGIDVGLEDRVLVVGEAVWAVRELEGAADECRDLAACDGLVGTESVVAGRVAAPGYVGSP